MLKSVMPTESDEGFRIRTGTNEECILDGESLSLEDVQEVAEGEPGLRFTPRSERRSKGRGLLWKRLCSGGEDLRGDHGFGLLCDQLISLPQIEELQRNLIRSHSVGVALSLMK